MALNSEAVHPWACNGWRQYSSLGLRGLWQKFVLAWVVREHRPGRFAFRQVSSGALQKLNCGQALAAPSGGGGRAQARQGHILTFSQVSLGALQRLNYGQHHHRAATSQQGAIPGEYEMMVGIWYLSRQRITWSRPIVATHGSATLHLSEGLIRSQREASLHLRRSL